MAIFLISELSALPKEKSLSHEDCGLDFGEFMHFRGRCRPGYRNVMTTNSADAAVESVKTAQSPEIQTVCGGAKTRD